MKYIESSDSGESGGEILSSTQWKLSSSLDSRTTLRSYSRQSEHSTLVISEDPEDKGADGSESISVDDILVSTARTTPHVFESASLTKHQPCLKVPDTNREWEARKIISNEYIDSVLHYLVE